LGRPHRSVLPFGVLGVIGMNWISKAVFIFGFGAITFGFLHWVLVGHYTRPDPTATEGDARLIASFQQMIVWVATGIVAVSVSAYLSGRARRKRG